MFNFNVLAGYSADFLHKTKEILLHLARERYPRVTLEEVSQSAVRYIKIVVGLKQIKTKRTKSCHLN